MASSPGSSTDIRLDQARIDEFLRRFFGPGNDANLYPQITEPFIESLRRGDDTPAVLPRFVEDRDWFALYVIADSPSAIELTAALIEAFAGPTYCSKGDVVPAELDPDDPVEAAVIDLAGTDRTFIVEAGSNPARRAKLRTALALMQRTVASRPARLWHVAKPLGRLLAEFEAALAAGGEAASQAILDQIAAQGGVTATNLAHLRIRRLDQLGRSEELLSLDGLANVLRQDPPLPIKEAVLNAVYSSSLSGPLQRGDIEAACDALRDSGSPLPLPLHDNIAEYGDDAAATLMTAAVGRLDRHALERMVSVLLSTGRAGAVPSVLWAAATSLLETAGTPTPATREEDAQEQAVETSGEQSEATLREPEKTRDAEHADGRVLTVAGTPHSWPALFDAVAQDSPTAKEILRDETWQSWASPAESDVKIGQILDGLADAPWARVWHLAGPFIEAVGYSHPAPRSARAFITYALAFDRLGPGDLIALQALTEICLRASPTASDYRLLLGEIADSCPQWVSPENALVALDFADRLVLAACPDDSARMNLAVALLDPLNSRQGRLNDADIDFARQLSDELGVPLEWRAPEEQPDEGESFATLPSMSVLLYSLDSAVLDRTSAELQRLAPRIKITISHDKVGTDPLKKKSRNADVIVLATRCAKHAATGFITENARTAVITYADGSGSASLLRAATDGLRRAALEI